MAKNKNKRNNGSMTVEEAGRLGGQERKRQEEQGIGPSYEEIGEKGGRARADQNPRGSDDSQGGNQDS
jgi:uncharacterized protein